VTDFLNDLIARSVGTPETVKPRPASIFEPVEPEAGPLEPPPADVAETGDLYAANLQHETSDFPPFGHERTWKYDAEAERQALEPVTMPPEPAAPEGERRTPEPEPQRSLRHEPRLLHTPDQPQERHRFETKPVHAQSRTIDVPGPDLTPAPPMDERPSAARADEPAPRSDQNVRFATDRDAESASPLEPLCREETTDGSKDSAPTRDDADLGSPARKASIGKRMDEDPLARMLRKLAVPPRVRTVPKPVAVAPQGSLDMAAPPLTLVSAETGEATDQAKVHPLRRAPPEIPGTKAEARPAQPEHHPEARAQPAEDARGRGMTGRRDKRLTSMRLTPVPESVLSLPAVRPAETTVHITIGRVEVRGMAGTQEATAPRRPQPSLMSLDDYLKQRSARDG